MGDQFWLSEAQLRQIKPYFPLAHGVPRVDDRRVVSGIIHVIRNGLRWRTRQRRMAPIKPCITAFFAGRGWGYSPGFSPRWQRQEGRRTN